MMSSAKTRRAGRAPKDKKPQPVLKTVKNKDSSESSKTSDGIVSKIPIIEITGPTTDAALVALHDCDNDTDRAAIMLLEGNQDEGKWETSGKKKRNRHAEQKAPEVNGHNPAPVEKEEKEPVENTRRRREKQREGGCQFLCLPPMNWRRNQGCNWVNKENEKNIQENKRERNTEGRSRGPRKNFSSGNGSDVAVTEEWSKKDCTENLGIFEIPSFSDFESQQEAILSSRPSRKVVTASDIVKLAAECVKDDCSDENSDHDKTLTDPALLTLKNESVEVKVTNEYGPPFYEINKCEETGRFLKPGARSRYRVNGLYAIREDI